MSVFNRVYKIARAEMGAGSDRLDDPIKAVQQGLNELKRELAGQRASLADLKNKVNLSRRDVRNAKLLADDYQSQAIKLLQKGRDGLLDGREADRRAVEALEQKAAKEMEGRAATEELEKLQAEADRMQSRVDELQSLIKRTENELLSLKSRSRSAAAASRINEISARFDPGETLAMIETMKGQIEEEEALAEAWGEMVDDNSALDQEIDQALASDPKPDPSQALERLKKRMGLE